MSAKREPIPDANKPVFVKASYESLRKPFDHLFAAAEDLGELAELSPAGPERDRLRSLFQSAKLLLAELRPILYASQAGDQPKTPMLGQAGGTSEIDEARGEVPHHAD